MKRVFFGMVLTGLLTAGIGCCGLHEGGLFGHGHGHGHSGHAGCESGQCDAGCESGQCGDGAYGGQLGGANYAGAGAGAGAAGAGMGHVAYPYYTVRGPRDFLADY